MPSASWSRLDEPAFLRRRISPLPSFCGLGASVMATTLLLAMTGETFMLSSQPIWVRDVAVALAVDDRGNIPDEDISA
ncbi:MAG: hypothetical protein EOQ49_24925 [Mesorhizobium sp.]|nr:MAG: hypothetical protein EOQ49_24925 [Mesorhizobium sp.]